jgi:predicted O-methyltransferase YrrM
MTEILSAAVDRFVRAVGPEPTDLQDEMDEHAAKAEFPHVGPAVGGWLFLLARLVDATRVFEFGSGYGYSASWWARALPEDGQVVLTDVDEAELDLAREYAQRGGFTQQATFEHGDAMATIERYDGPFDAVLIDHQKHSYEAAFEAVRDKLAPGGVIVADNAMTAGVVDFETLLAAMEGESIEGATEHTRGVAAYLRTVQEDPAFETALLPVGEGIAVSHRTPK